MFAYPKLLPIKKRDMIKFYKLVSGKYDAAVSDLFPVVRDCSKRGHSIKFIKGVNFKLIQK